MLDSCSSGSWAFLRLPCSEVLVSWVTVTDQERSPADLLGLSPSQGRAGGWGWGSPLLGCHLTPARWESPKEVSGPAQMSEC